MADGEIHAVTGAFGFSGKYIAARLLERGIGVRTLTNAPLRRDPFGGRVPAYPLRFDRPEELHRSLEGVRVLYNTYYVRFNRFDSRGRPVFGFDQAVENSRKIFQAAREAGVRRIVHLSITNPDPESALPYFAGKGRIEAALAGSGLSSAVLRPALIFGREDVLINNICWMLRRFPLFPLLGKGDYRLQPIHVDDLAALAVEHGLDDEESTVDAIGPETFTFRGLVEELARALGLRRLVFPAPPWLAYVLARTLGVFVGDITLSRDEVKGLMAEKLYVESPPAGKTALSAWTRENAASLGVHYASEIRRRLR